MKKKTAKPSKVTMACDRKEDPTMVHKLASMKLRNTYGHSPKAK